MIYLVTASGIDAPGITSEMTGVLADHAVEILDVAQALVQDLLSLSLFFSVDEATTGAARDVIHDLTSKATALKLKLEWKEVDRARVHTTAGSLPHHYAVTLIAETITARALHEVTRVLAHWKLNIDGIKKLSENHFGCVEMRVSTQNRIDSLAATKLRKELLTLANEQGVDIAFQAEGLYRRAKRLVVLDMDSTLICGEVIDELARENGVYDEVSAITQRAMRGKMDFNESLTLRCAMLKGMTVEDLERVYQKIQITPGADDLIRVLHRLGYKTAVISGGFTFVADRLKERLGIHFAYANTLEIVNGRLTGRVLPPIINAQRKADLLEVIAQQEKIVLDQVIAIGDGANDLLMLEKAGLGIAFNAKPVVCEKADLALSQKNMRSILYLLGLSARDVEQVIGK